MLLLLRYFYLLQITVLLLTTPDRKGHHHLILQISVQMHQAHLCRLLLLPYLTPLPLILCMHHLKLARTIHYCSSLLVLQLPSAGTKNSLWHHANVLRLLECVPHCLDAVLRASGPIPGTILPLLLPAASVRRLYPHDGYASYCGTPVRMLHCPLQPVLWKAYSNNFAQQSTLRMHR